MAKHVLFGTKVELRCLKPLERLELNMLETMGDRHMMSPEWHGTNMVVTFAPDTGLDNRASLEGGNVRQG